MKKPLEIIAHLRGFFDKLESAGKASNKYVKSIGAFLWGEPKKLVKVTIDFGD